MGANNYALSIKTSLGRFKTIQGQTQGLTDLISADLKDVAYDKLLVQRLIQDSDKAATAAKMMQTAANRQMNAIGSYIASMMGTIRSNATSTTFNLSQLADPQSITTFLGGATRPSRVTPQDLGGILDENARVTWLALSAKTIERKEKINPSMARMYFYETGDLKSHMEKNGNLIAKRVGKVEVKYQDFIEKNGKQLKSEVVRRKNSRGQFLQGGATKFIYGEFRIKLGSGTVMDATNAKAILSGDISRYDPQNMIERSIFRADAADKGSVAAKLRGPYDPRTGEHRFRPLVEPVLAYFLYIKIPKAMSNALGQFV